MVSSRRNVAGTAKWGLGEGGGMRRTLAVVALGLVVVTAGCGGGSQTEAPSATPTHRDQPSPTGTAADVPYPPGVTDQGVADPEALLAAHRSGLSGESLRVAIQYVVTTNGSGQRANFTGRVDPSTDRALLHVDLAGGTADYYAEGNETYVRQVVGTETRYRAGVDAPGLTATRLGSDRFVEAALGTANFTPSGTVTRDGTRLVRLEVTAVDREFGGSGRNATRTVDGSLLVDEEGVVRHVTVRAAVETDAGGSYEYRVEVHITDVGSTDVDPPDWIDEARDGS